MTDATTPPITVSADLAHLPKALQPLTEQKSWVTWRWDWRWDKDLSKGKWTKAPYQREYYRESAKSDDPSTWYAYETAVAAVAAGHANGIDYMLQDAEVAAVDLDKGRDPQTGEILDWAKDLCTEADALGLYREVTVSGKGFRFIGQSQKPSSYFIQTSNGQFGNFLTREEAERELEALIDAGKYKHDDGVSVRAANYLHANIKKSDKTGIELFRYCNRFITISGLQEKPCESLGSIDEYLDRLKTNFKNQPALTIPPTDGPPTDGLDLNTAGLQKEPKTDAYYEDLIKNGSPQGGRGALFQSVVWHLAGKGWTAEQIFDELENYPNGIGLKYAGRLRAEVNRSFGKYWSERRARVTGVSLSPMMGAGGAGTGTSPGAAGAASAGVAVASVSTTWPKIEIRAGELPRVVNEAEDALILFGSEIYQRNGMLVRPWLNRSLKTSGGHKTSSWQLIPVTGPYLIDQLSCAAQFKRYDKRAKDWVAANPPDKVAEIYLHRQGGWRLPHLVGVVNTPFLRVDGSICETAGYDPESRVLFKPETQTFSPVPQYPSKTDAKAALAVLKKLIETFPFVTDADRSVALAAMLTVIDRRSMAHAPLIGVSAPTTRSGKSLLVKLMGIIATGRAVPVKSQGKDEKEFENRLGANLIAGDVCISIGNCSRPLTGDMLCSALTEDEVEVRVLGLSRNIKTATIATIFATGNNLIIAEDLSDRSLIIVIDAGVERPGLREFSIDVEEETYARRGELVIAILTILRAWHVARQQGERIKVETFGGFTDWSRRVREPLIWLDEADPCDTIKKVLANDPVRDQLETILVQWEQHLGTSSVFTIQELLGRAVNIPTFHTALMNIAASKTGGGVISNDRLGRWLKQVEGRIVGGMKLVRVGIQHGYSTWSLSKVN